MAVAPRRRAPEATLPTRFFIDDQIERWIEIRDETGQLVTVRLTVGRIGERSFRLEYDLFGEKKEHLATAATVHVSVDPATGRSIAISPQLRSLLEKYAAPA